MTTKFAFGYGDGDIYRRRMRAQDEMFRRTTQEQQQLPEEDQVRMHYESDYYGFRGAGRRAGTTAARQAVPPRGNAGEQQGHRKSRNR